MSVIESDVIQQIGYQICPNGNMDALVRGDFTRLIEKIAEKELEAHKLTEDVKMIKVLKNMIVEDKDPERQEYYFKKLKEFLGDG